MSALSLLVAFLPTPTDDTSEQRVPENGEGLLMAQIAQISVEDIRSTTVPSSRGGSADGRAEVEHVAAEVERKSNEYMDVEASGQKSRAKNPTNLPHACECIFNYPAKNTVYEHSDYEYIQFCHQSSPTPAVCTSYTSSRRY